MKQKLFLDSAIETIDKKYVVNETKNSSFETIHYIVVKENKKRIHRNIGDYFVLKFDYEKILINQKLLEKETEKILKSFLKKYEKTNKVLVIGLGNETVLADSLGVYVTNKVIATNHYQDFLTIPKIALFNPSVTDKTGISSYNLISMVVHDMKPDIIIMIDSLATNNPDYLNNAIEINNTGIIPGSAINAAKKISEKTFHIPIISIGVPVCLLYEDKVYNSTFIKDVIEYTSDIIANALNDIFIKH